MPPRGVQERRAAKSAHGASRLAGTFFENRAFDRQPRRVLQGAEFATNAGFLERGKGAPVIRVTYITILVIYVARGGGVFFFFYFFLSKKHFLYVYICAYIKKKKKKNLSPLAFRDRLAGWFWGIDLTGRERGGLRRRDFPAVRSGGAQPLCEGRQARGHCAAVWACRCVRVCA